MSTSDGKLSQGKKLVLRCRLRSARHGVMRVVLIRLPLSLLYLVPQ